MFNLNIDFKKEETKKAILIGILSILVLVSYFNFLIKPQLDRTIRVFQKTGKVGGELKAALFNIENIEKFKSDMDGYRQKVSKYEKMLPAEQEIPSLLESLSQMANTSNVKIDAITPFMKNEEKKQSGQAYREMSIKINAKSGYHELGRFLASLENSDRFMKVVGMKVKANKATPKKHDVELVVITYILLSEN